MHGPASDQGRRVVDAELKRNGARSAAGRKAVARPPVPRTSKRTASSLTEKVYDRLRADILTCALPPGQDMSEAELAARFAVSKTPVREALATLRQEGFVRTFPRRGYQVVPITIGDMNELFDTRTILEAGAAELACVRITEAALTRLEHLADVVYDRSEQPSLKRFIQANREFHTAVAEATGNERLCHLVARQMDELERFFYLGARLRDVNAEVRGEHHRIVDVLRSRDPAAARQIMIEHNEQTRRGLREAIAEARGFSRLSL
jgi:DNA-binding GntR family transcriptional regulator